MLLNVNMYTPLIFIKSHILPNSAAGFKTGTRKAKRYKKITVSWQDQRFWPQTGTFEGYTAQIIQHEVDHCDGVLI